MVPETKRCFLQLSNIEHQKLCLTYLAALPDLKGSPGKDSSVTCVNVFDTRNDLHPVMQGPFQHYTTKL